ncbi:MAG: type II toxin-antitoxin system RelE/ParE family toxin [Alphaproteobacteria bacterium]|nr:type II toxin-antitoxin system RelE/ParE family toxin [Alphaproteobacteria bacterium]
MIQALKRLPAAFYRTATGNEPVREWLRTLAKEDRLRIGSDIRTVEYGWPMGMPTCRPMGQGLYEVRTNLDNRVARVLFCVTHRKLLLLHGFIKKTAKTPPAELELATIRKRQMENSR